MPIFKPSSRLLALALMPLLSACGHTDHYPLYNAATNQTVECRSGVYWLSKDRETQAVADRCIAICVNHGFQSLPVTGAHDDAVVPYSPDDLRSLTPDACLN